MSAEFLKRARERLLKTTDRTLRAAVIVSQLGLAGGPPPPSPKEFFASGPGISTELRPEQTNQQTEEERVAAEIRRIFELRDLAAVERKISPSYFAWLTSTSRYLSLSVEQAMGLFRTAFEKRQPQCLAFRVSGEGQNKKISVLLKDFGVLKWDGEPSAASFVELTPYQGNWFMSSVGELPKDTLENVQRNSTDLRPCPPRTPESQEQRLFSEVSVFGLSAEFTDKGNIVISSIDGRRREINLPPLAEFYSHFGGMEFSPDGTRLVAWRDSHDKGREGYTLFLISPQTGEFRPIFSDFVRSLNYLSRSIDLEWSQDSKKLRIASGHHGRGKGIVVDIDTEQILFEYRGGIYGRFSPDGNWFARIEEKDLEVRRISDGYSFTIRNNGEDFSWSPDSQSITMQKCTRWTGTAWGDICESGMLSLYNLSTRRAVDNIAQTNIKERPVFSPDGKKILFDTPRSRGEGSGLKVYDLESKRIVSITIPERVAVLDENWQKMFHESGLVFVYPTTQERFFASIYWFDPNEDRMIASQAVWVGRDVKVRIKGIFNNNFICELTYTDGTAELYRAPLNPQRSGPIERFRIGPYIPQGPLNRREELFGFLKDGDLLSAGGQTLLFQGGKKYLIENEEAAEYLGGQMGTIPEGLVPFVPEGEKISFLPGDVVGNKDSGIWYLRNGKRYKVPNWDWFRNRQRFNVGDNQEFRRGEWIVSKELIERIPEGEMPPPALGETGIRDWDGTMKEFQPFGGRMIIFMGGYNGNTQSQQEAFQRIKEKLVERGWRENQFLEATYNIDIDAQRRLVLPKAYLAKDTKVYPPQSVSKLRLQLQQYKEIFPLTSFIIVGHSLGGFEGFEAALAHPDAVQAVITLDSPLKGVDRAFLVELPGLLDQAVEMVGDEVMKYMNALGDSPARRQEQEAKAWQLYTRKVRVFTFSNDDDWFVRNGVAVLENSASEFEGQPVRLIWQLGHFSPRDIEDLASGHGQILQEESFLEQLVKILPSS